MAGKINRDNINLSASVIVLVAVGVVLLALVVQAGVRAYSYAKESSTYERRLEDYNKNKAAFDKACEDDRKARSVAIEADKAYNAAHPEPPAAAGADAYKAWFHGQSPNITKLGKSPCFDTPPSGPAKPKFRLF